MSFLYPYTSNITASINSASYLTETDSNLFIRNKSSDLWFSVSDKDSIEFSVYDLDKNLVSWKSFENLGEFKKTNFTVYDEKNNSVSYTYNQFVFEKPLYKTEKILIDPTSDISSSNLSSGNYILSYQFTRYLAGSPSNPLVVKEISPSKTEIKLLPYNKTTIEYDSFCVNKVPIDDICALYLRMVKNCPYERIYQLSVDGNESSIQLVKNLFFISSDGKFIEFLKKIYEDFISYSSNLERTTVKRIQGIKTYFTNFLMLNTSKSFSFDEIKAQYEKFVTDRLQILFINYKNDQYNSAKKYLFDVFTKYYFTQIHEFLQTSYLEKYGSPLKNALSYGGGNYIPILNTAYLDERDNETDPLTLLVKLQHPISDDISVKSTCWISNISMVPVLFNVIIGDQSSKKTLKISPPDFTIVSENVSLLNTNDYYSSEDLTLDNTSENNVNISKKIKELNIDYSDFNNFILFSSAELRHNIFKNKMISLCGISQSLSTLEYNYSSSGYTYSNYTEEKNILETNCNNIIDTFDGWESYLYKTGYYVYNPTLKEFYSSSYVSTMDTGSVVYDKKNRDSLVNNTPEYILTDSENDDYVIFLSMVGHYFDNLYLYIKALPSQNTSNDVYTLSENILRNMLQSFGWKIDTSLETLNISDNYLDTLSGGSNTISADEKTRQIWGRILTTLPIIYKSKGTDECIRLLLSCYGIPSTLIDIKEYGGVENVGIDKTSYSIEEKLFLLTFKGYREYLSIPFVSTIKTIELKASLDANKDYIPYEKIPLAVKYNQYDEIDWTIGIYKEPTKYVGRAYFELAYPTYEIGVIGDYGIINSTYSQSIQVASSLTSINPDIIVTTGDNTYETGTNAYDNTVGWLYHKFICPYVGVSGSGADVNRFYPSIGNHDYIGSSYSQYLSFFSGLSQPRYYTFRKGNVQFFMLNSDSNEPSGTLYNSNQEAWFESEISSSHNDPDILWRIAVFHHPITSSRAPDSHTAQGEVMRQWDWALYGIDMMINGHEHNYERLEYLNIPIIIQGAGGASLYDFNITNQYSKFKFSNIHSYSVITTKGNYLRLDTYDMFGNKIQDTGSTSLTSCSIENGSFVMRKSLVPFSDRPFRQIDKYILTDPIPIFNGDIFNLMLRRNEPDELFEYNINDDLVPTKFDLWIQRKDDGRTIYSSYTHSYLTQTYNYRFSSVGTLYFGNYQHSSSFVGQMDKILLWEDAISDATYNDHTNNISSYSYTGSYTPHEVLYYRLNCDYPFDLALTNPTKIVNSNEIYSSSVWVDAYNFSIGSYSCSLDNCIWTSHSVYPYQFKEYPYNQTYAITSYGPNKTKNRKIQKATLDLSVRLDPNDRSTSSPIEYVSPDSNQIGLFADPNSYKNKDIFRYLGDYGVTELLANPSQLFEDRYYPLKTVRDLYNKSGNKKTYYNELFTLYKFYFDKSIFQTIKQLIPSRNTILSGILIEPTVLERPKYQYKHVFTETGVSDVTSSAYIPITSSNNVYPTLVSLYNILDSKINVTVDCISADFKIDESVVTSNIYENIPFYIPEGPYFPTDPLYIEFLKLKSTTNLTFCSFGWVKRYPSVDKLTYWDNVPDSTTPFNIYLPLPFSSSTTPQLLTPDNINYVINNVLPGYYYSDNNYILLKNCWFYSVKSTIKNKKLIDTSQKNNYTNIDLSRINLLNNDRLIGDVRVINDIENNTELGSYCDDKGKIVDTHFSGSKERYLIKTWNRNDVFYRKDGYNRPQEYNSQSYYTVCTETWNSDEYEKLVYTASTDVTIPPQQVLSYGAYLENPKTYWVVPDYSSIYYSNGIFTEGIVFRHNKNTFKQRPNSTFSNIFSSGSTNFLTKIQPTSSMENCGKFYETFNNYSRNHLTRKTVLLTKESKPIISRLYVSSSYVTTEGPPPIVTEYKHIIISCDRWVKSRQTKDTTVGLDGLVDFSLPIETINVSNINIVKTDNVLT